MYVGLVYILNVNVLEVDVTYIKFVLQYRYYVGRIIQDHRILNGQPHL